MSRQIFRLLNRNAIRDFNCIRFQPVSNILLCRKFSSPPKGNLCLCHHGISFFNIKYAGFGRFSPKQQQSDDQKNGRTKVENKGEQKKAEG